MVKFIFYVVLDSLNESWYYVYFKKGNFFRFSQVDQIYYTKFDVKLTGNFSGFRGPMTNLVGHWIMVFVARLYGKCEFKNHLEQF